MGRCCARPKSLTTRNDLSLGIKGAIEKLDHTMFKHIHLVAISSTLATNSVVEGKGCRVGLILAGNDVAANIPVDEIVRIKGGHTLQGEAKEELEIEAARLFVLHTQDKVDGYAISSYLSVRNPEHEIALKAMVKSITDKPVVCGHELSLRARIQREGRSPPYSMPASSPSSRT